MHREMQISEVCHFCFDCSGSLNQIGFQLFTKSRDFSCSLTRIHLFSITLLKEKKYVFGIKNRVCSYSCTSRKWSGANPVQCAHRWSLVLLHFAFVLVKRRTRGKSEGGVLDLAMSTAFSKASSYCLATGLSCTSSARCCLNNRKKAALFERPTSGCLAVYRWCPIKEIHGQCVKYNRNDWIPNI